MPCDINILGNQTIAALTCASDDICSVVGCVAICANPDLAGIGVRVAFYFQSIMNTLLVAISPRDSVPTAWASTLLTAALVIAAIVQKIAGGLTLHHASLVLNFATLSCISSLAAAPMLPIWRLRPADYIRLQLTQRGIHDPHGLANNTEWLARHEKKIIAEQNRGRVVLSLALLTQVVLQWAWGIVLFVSPVYSQKSCSGSTTLIMFLAPFTVNDIEKNGLFVVWVLWLLFSLGITLYLSVVLTLSGPSRAHDILSRRNTFSSANSGDSATMSAMKRLLQLAINCVPLWKDKTRQMIFWGNILAFALWSIYIISSEQQIAQNCIFKGENDFRGFGQITAILLSLAPVWSLTIALYRYPAILRKNYRRRQQAMKHNESLPQDLDNQVLLSSPARMAGNLVGESDPIPDSREGRHKHLVVLTR